MTDHRRTTLVALLAALAVTSLAAAAFAEGGARGRFTTPAAELGVTDAYAFNGTSSLGEPGVVVVAVSNAGFQAAEIDAYWDRRYVIEHFFKDEETGVVFFEFDRDGRYRGLSYYFGPGDGCGYCSGGVTSTVRRDGDRLVGKLTQAEQEGERSFEIDLDVRVASDDHGAPQGAGGGAPGAAFTAYDRALRAGDRAALHGLLSAERNATWAGAEEKGDSDGFLAYLRSEHPRALKVTQAYVRDARALVLFEGEGENGKIRGEAFLALEGGSWRFEEETVQPVYD